MGRPQGRPVSFSGELCALALQGRDDAVGHVDAAGAVEWEHRFKGAAQLRGDGFAHQLARPVLAEAVQELWPTTQVTIGPTIENGFYYDFKRDTPFSEDDFPVIEKKMAEIVARGAAFRSEERRVGKECRSRG